MTPQRHYTTCVKIPRLVLNKKEVLAELGIKQSTFYWLTMDGVLQPIAPGFRLYAMSRIERIKEIMWFPKRCYKKHTRKQRKERKLLCAPARVRMVIEVLDENLIS